MQEHSKSMERGRRNRKVCPRPIPPKKNGPLILAQHGKWERKGREPLGFVPRQSQIPPEVLQSQFKCQARGQMYKTRRCTARRDLMARARGQASQQQPGAICTRPAWQNGTRGREPKSFHTIRFRVPAIMNCMGNLAVPNASARRGGRHTKRETARHGGI